MNTVEDPKVHALVKIGPIEETVLELVRKFDGIIYDVSTPKGIATARADRAELRAARVNLEAARKNEKSEVVAKGKYIDSEAARIRLVIEKYEDPLAEKIKAEDDRKEEEKRLKVAREVARVAAIMGNIEHIKVAPTHAVGMDSEGVACLISRLESVAIGDDEYQEFRALAQDTKVSTLQTLTDMHNEKLAKETEAARVLEEKQAEERLQEAVRVERDRMAQIEADRLAAEKEAFRLEKEEQKRKQQEIDAARAEERRAELAALDVERKKAQDIIDAQQADVNRQKEELSEVARKQEEAAAEEARLRKEAIGKEEQDMLAVLEAEKAREGETVTVLKVEYLMLVADRKVLEALIQAGVDNWSGYDFAMELLERNG